MKQAGLTPDRDAVRLIADRVEGNLLAAQQEIEKLRLLHGEGPVTAGDVDAAATTDEIALAGKGFNQQVEDEYKSSRKIDFTPVDRMEQRRESRDALLGFVKQGGLGGAE